MFLFVFKGDLIATGTFMTAGGQSARRIARWDGEQWHAFDEGLTGATNTFGVLGGAAGLALADYNGDLIAGGTFLTGSHEYVSRVARWSERSGRWRPMDTGLPEPAHAHPQRAIHALLPVNGSLLAGRSHAFSQTGDALLMWKDD